MILLKKLCAGNLIIGFLLIFVSFASLASSRSVDVAPSSIFGYFKAVLMYFSEPFLRGAKFGNEALEGEHPLITSKHFVKIIDDYVYSRGDNCTDERIARLKVFKVRLEAGIGLAVLLESTADFPFALEAPESYGPTAQLIQNYAIEYLDKLGGLVIPAKWVGHGFALIINESGTDLYDLTVINSSQGIGHHYHRKDPGSVYPYLSRLWIEFKNIPKEKLFDSKNYWFICALVVIGQKHFTTQLTSTFVNDKNYISNYFYGSLLSNFRDYLVQPEKDELDEKLFPEQQSGSCAMYSLIGALLYFSDSLETFHWYRLNLGHVFIGTFLEKLTSEVDSKFFNVLTNGFFSGGIRHLKGLIKALAIQQLQYLELRFPNEFKHAGLIGSGRSTWNTENNVAAVEKLSTDETAQEELKSTLKLAKLVGELVTSLQLRYETTHIVDISKDFKKFKTLKSEISSTDDKADGLKFTMGESKNIYSDILAGKPERIEVSLDPILTFENFYESFKELFYMKDYNLEVYFLRFLDIFKRLHAGPNWLLIIQHHVKDDLLQLQDWCKEVALKFVDLSNQYTNENRRRASLDEITLLGHLQLLSWYLFRAYHTLTFSDSPIDWEALAPPQTVQSVLFEFIRGNLEYWPIKGFNDITNYDLYKIFIESSPEIIQLDPNVINHFPGPEIYSKINSKIDGNNYPFEKIMANTNLKEGIFDYFLNFAEIDDILRRTIMVNSKWECLSPLNAKFLVVLCVGQEKLYDLIPHFYNLMSTLHLLRNGVRSQGRKIEIHTRIEHKRFWTKPDHDIANIQFTVQPKLNDYSINSLDWRSKINNQLNPFEVKDHPNIYSLIHSYALPEHIGATDVGTWLNYIKNAGTGKIFDQSYFQYLTDHLLNIPKYMPGSKDAVLLFTEDMSKTIILNLIQLVKITLNELFDQSGKISVSLREIIVSRAVNISVILTRFISRADYLFSNSHYWAEKLAKLYNTILPYSNYNSDVFGLSDLDISRLNFALSHMCYTFLSKPEKFIKSINLGFDHRNEKHRKTLARFHWFIAKTNYIISNNDMIADDQFKYGFTGSPLAHEEARFLEEALLKKMFLKNFLRNEYDYSFRYDLDGYVVEITYDKNVRPPKRARILINLATGTIIDNGLLVASKSQFINSYEFRNLFKPIDHAYLATFGKAFSFSGIPVFVLPTLKGSDFMMIKFEENIWAIRMWNNNWYIWRPEKYCEDFYLPLDYSWTGENVRMFKKYNSTRGQVEVIIFEEYAKDPIVQITKIVQSKNQFQLSVPGLTDGITAAILEKDFLEMHIKEFAEDGISFARKEADGTIVVVFNSYRLSENATKPFVLTAYALEKRVWVRNEPNMEISTDQRVGEDGYSLPGSLVALTDGKKILLLPFAEVLKKSTLKSNSPRPYIYIEKIPMVEDSSTLNLGDQIAVAAPQSLRHKLLLAYYMILAQNYNAALKLLYPSTSINLNEAFSKDELDVITWIMRIDMNNPEFNTLKLMLYSYLLINKAKFAFLPGTELNDTSIKYDYLVDTYMMSFRELPEKYNIFKILPDILDSSSILSKAFFPVYSNNHSKFITIPSEKFKFPEESGSVGSFQFGSRVKLGEFIHLLNDQSPRPSSEMIKHFLIRNNSSLKFDYSMEMAVYCYISNPSLWTRFKSLYKNEADMIRLSKDHLFQADFKLILSRCHDLFKNDFDEISLARFSERTNPEKIQNTIRNDLEICDGEYDIENHDVKLVTEEDRNRLLSFQENLIVYINSLSNGNVINQNFGFNPDLVESCSVLGSLFTSINSFISKRGLNEFNNLDIPLDSNLLESFRELNLMLKEKISALEVMLQSLTGVLIDITFFKGESSSLPIAIDSLFSMIHQRKAKAFSDLYSCYSRNSLSCIRKKFPQLSYEHCLQIKADATLFFSQQILFDYYESIQKRLKNFFSTSSVRSDDLLMFCDELDKISDFNKRLQSPVIMNFEFRSRKYRLKKAQVADISLLTSENSENNNFRSVVIQRMMAAGKTLILGTVSVVMKALSGKGRLSILVPPSSLFQSNTTDMQARTYRYFKKKGNNFIFPRLPLPKDQGNADKILEFLDNIINLINRTIADRNYLILSPDHLLSFLNSYIEMIASAEDLYTNSKYVEVLKRFAAIYKIFSDKSSIIFDEIDMTMNPKKELNFPTLEIETYNMTAVAMLADIIEFMVFDQNIKDIGLNIHANNQAALTLSNFVACRVLVLKYIEEQLNNDNSIWRIFISKDLVDQTIEFLKAENISDGKDWILELSEGGKEYLANALIIVKTQLYLHLKEFLSVTVNQNYGSAESIRPTIKYAVPYVAANTPSNGSVFADRWETLMKTLLMISASPCSKEIAKDVIKYARKAIISESARVPGAPIRTMPTFINLKVIVGDTIDPLSLNANDESHVTLIHNALIRRSPADIRILISYYINEVIAKMEFPVEQITSNALNMARMFGSVQGYSGTIDNVNILPQEVIEEASLDHEANEVHNGGIALKLIQDFGNYIIPELDDRSFRKDALEMMQDLLSLVQNNHQLNAIIDTGAFFKNFKNRKVAEAILSLCGGRIEVVLYYDESSNQLEFIRGIFKSGRLTSITDGYLETTDPDDINTTTQTEINKRFTFYDQRHNTGSDILQPKFAQAIMTADPRVLLRDILQGALRMRQFMTSQKVHLVVTASLREFYHSRLGHYASDENKKSIRASDLLTLGAMNEEEKQANENEKIAFSKIDAEIRSFVLYEISNILTQKSGVIYLARIKTIFKETRDLFIRSIRESPLSWLSEQTLQDSEYSLQQHINRRLEKLRLFANLPEEKSRYTNLKERLELMTGSLLNYLKKEIQVGSNQEIGKEVSIQNHIQTLASMKVEFNQLVQEMNGIYLFPELYSLGLLEECKKQIINSTQNNFFSLQSIYDSQTGIGNQLTKAVLLTKGDKIGVTGNLVRVYKGTDVINRFPIFSKYTLEGSHLLVYTWKTDYSDPKVLLISPEHASKAFKDIKSGHGRLCENSEFWLCDLAGDIVISTQRTAETVRNIFNVAGFESIIEKLIFDLLIYNGSLPQILSNSKLKMLYKNDWLIDDNFKDRASFLLVRMKVLLEKNLCMFEDYDEEYSALKQYSLGNNNPDRNISRSDGYPKELNPLLHSRFDQLRCDGALASKEQLNTADIENRLAVFFKQKKQAKALENSYLNAMESNMVEIIGISLSNVNDESSDNDSEKRFTKTI